MTNPDELFPVVDEDGNKIGEALRSVCHDGRSMLLHPVVHLHLFNNSGELFLQKRAMTKDIQPGKWDTSVGGHLTPGETIEEALAREAYEELGLTNFEPLFLGKYVWESSREKELVSSFSATANEVPLINKDEIEDGRFWSLHDIKEGIGKNIFTPNFENEFEMFFIKTPGMKPNKTFLSLILLAILTTVSWITSCTHDAKISDYPEICFSRDVLPIFQNNCAISRCHDGRGGESRMALDNYTDISRTVVPGNPGASRSYKTIIATWGGNNMPPNQPLSLENRTIIRLWIEQGAGLTTCPGYAGTGQSMITGINISSINNY